MLDAELSLADAVPQPMKAHVYALRQFRGDCVISEPDGKFIVTQDGGGRLRVAEIVENTPLFEGDFGGGKKTPVFGLLDRRTDDGNTVRAAGDGSVDEGWLVVAAKGVVRATDAARFRAREIGRIGPET